MYYTEIVLYIIDIAFNTHMGTPFSVYGEMVFLLLQSGVIVLLIWAYRDDIPTSEKIIIGSGIMLIGVYLISDKYVPEYLWPFVMNCQFVIIFYARIPQILSNYRHQSTGQLSIITCALNAVGTVVRLLTIFKESESKLTYISSGLGMTFNVIILIQVLWYWNSEFKESSDDKNDSSQTKKPRSKPKHKID